MFNPPSGRRAQTLHSMKQTKMKKVHYQNLRKNWEQILKAAQEGRLYVAMSPNASEDEVKNQVRSYVSRIREMATQAWLTRVDNLWERVFGHPELMAMLMPKRRARKCREFDKYGVMRLVGVMRSYGVYDDKLNDLHLCEALEGKKGDCCYRSYIGMGIESRTLRRELKSMIEEF